VTSVHGSWRRVVAIIGSGGAIDAQLRATSLEVGRLAIDAGFRVVTGGLGGVMGAASEGARSSAAWRDGDVVGVIPSYDRSTANPHVDVVVPTGLQLGRNVIVVAMSDVVIAIGGGAGTLSELALAWQLGKPIVALGTAGGWAARLAGQAIDHRHAGVMHDEATPSAAVRRAQELVELARVEPGDIGSGWRRLDP